MATKSREKITKDSDLVRHRTIGFAGGKYERRVVRASGLKFSGLYEDNRLWVRYLIVITIGILMAFVGQLLLKNTGLYMGGLSSIVQGFARLTNTLMHKYDADPKLTELIYNLMFWILYFFLNIPLFFLGYKYVGKTFTKLTCVYLLVNCCFGFALSYVPGINEIFIFGNTTPAGMHCDGCPDTEWTQNYLAERGVQVLPMFYGGNYIPYHDRSSINTPMNLNHISFFTEEVDYNVVVIIRDGIKYPIFVKTMDPIKSLYLVLYGVSYGIIAAGCYSIIYIISACSGGLDFVSFYYSVIKQKSVSNIIVIVNIVSLTFAVVLGSYVSGGILAPEDCWNFQWFFSANLIASYFCVLVFKLTINWLFPANKTIRVDAYTSKKAQIVERLKKANYVHSSTCIKGVGTYSGNEQTIFQTICMYPELPRVIKYIREVDPTCLISASVVKELDGSIRVLQQGSIE